MLGDVSETDSQHRSIRIEHLSRAYLARTESETIDSARFYKSSALLSLLAVMLFSTLIAPPACLAGQPRFKIKKASLSVSPSKYKDQDCACTFSFDGEIISEGSGLANYVFLRSDGSMSPVKTITFSGSGAYKVHNTWRVSNPGIKKFNGWMMIKVLFPNQLTSNKASFKMDCPEILAQAADLSISDNLITIGNQRVSNGASIVLTPSEMAGSSEGLCSFILSYKLANFGNKAVTSGCVNRIYYDRQVVGEQKDFTIRPGEKRLFSISIALPAGDHSITISLDDDKQILETDEKNNIVRIFVATKCP
jgi:hypothetical protein